jgi:hypothetical protein
MRSSSPEVPVTVSSPSSAETKTRLRLRNGVAATSARSIALAPGPPVTRISRMSAQAARPVPGSAPFTLTFPATQATEIASSASLATMSLPLETDEVTAALASGRKANREAAATATAA